MQTYININLNEQWLSVLSSAAKDKNLSVPAYVKSLLHAAHPEMGEVKQGRPRLGQRKEIVLLALGSALSLRLILDDALAKGLQVEPLSVRAFGRKDRDTYGNVGVRVGLSPLQVGAVKALSGGRDLRATALRISQCHDLEEYLASIHSPGETPL